MQRFMATLHNALSVRKRPLLRNPESSGLRENGRFLTDKALLGEAIKRCTKPHTMHLQCV